MATATQKAIGVEEQEKLAKKISQVLSPEEGLNYAFFMRRFERARDERNKPSRYFDGLDFVTDYITNEDAKNTYLRPKLNDAEVRVNTGTTEKKIEAVFNELLGMNLQHEVRAYDQDDLEIAELGDDMSDLITRTNQVEKDDDFWEEAVMELLTQRAVFIEECFEDYPIKRNSERVTRAKKHLLSGLQVFLGDQSIPAYLFDTQPYIFTYDRVHYKTAQAQFGHLPTWQHIQYTSAKKNEYLGGAFAYRFGILEDEEVEIIRYFSVPDNEYQVMINGVLMYPAQEKMPCSYPGYSIKMTVLKSMSNKFAYGRPLTAQAKTLQALSNESIRMLIFKFQQSLQPPYSSMKKLYSRDIWNPGTNVQGVKKDEITKLIDHNGPTESEFAMMRLIDQKTEEFVGAGNLQGLPTGQDRTSATEILTMQKQAVKMLGLAVLALSRMKRDLAELRIFTFFDYYLSPIRKRYNPISKEIENIYRSFTIQDAKLGSNQRGKKIIQLSERDLSPDEQDNLKQAEDQQAEIGNPIRVKNMNVHTMRDLIAMWYIVITPKEKEGSALDQVIFRDQLNQAGAISKLTGNPLDGPTIEEAFERKWKAKSWFQKKAQLQEQPGQDPNNPEANPVADKAQAMIDELQQMEGGAGAQVSRGLRSVAAVPTAGGG